MTTAPEDYTRQVIATPATTARPTTPKSSVPTTPLNQNVPVVKQETTQWVKAGTVQTANGPVDVDANGLAADGSKPVAVSGVRKYTATDGTEFTDQAAYATYQASLNNTADKKLSAEQAAAAAAAARLADRVSAYDLLYSEFDRYGLGSLVSDVKDSIIAGQSQSERLLALRGSKGYQLRFPANAQRINKGLRALSEAEYLAKEDAYQNLMREYGLPESYWKKDATGKQAGFDQLLANDVSATELENRLITAQDRVLKSNPEVLDALKQFYPGITNGDILAYTLDPKNALKDIQSKVTAAEIGGAAMQSGLATDVTRAEELQRYGVNKAAATTGFATIGAGLQRGSELAAIYEENPYTQTTAEQEIFNVPGAQEARRQRQKITGLEKASFGGKSGLTGGALARDRAGGV